MARLLPLLLLCALGCEEDTRRTDGGPIVRIDSAAPTFACDDPYVNLVTISEANPSEMILPRCAASTAQCAIDCADDNDCFDACLINDPTPPLMDPSGTLNCDDCFTLQSLSCLDNFCGPQFGPLRCCIDENSCESADCPACATQFAAFVACRDTDRVMCANFIGPCFAN